MPSRAGSQLRRLRDPRPPLHVLHIGKTGGTAVKHVLLEHLDDSRLRLLLHGHDVTTRHVPRGERFAFFLRDPISRFVSAFNGRAHANHPRYRYPWRDEEHVAFAVFKTPEQLASALSSADEDERTRAERAMHGIAHLNTPYRFWFGSVQSFRRRLSDVFFIGFQERLEEDFERLKRTLGLPSSALLPTDPIAANRSLRPPRDELGETARENLQRWYEDDLAFVTFCRELAPLINLEPMQSRRAPAGAITAPGVPKRLRRVAPRLVLPPLVGVAVFAATAAAVEALTDRDWSLSGLEWPADFITAAVLVCLVPVVMSGAIAILFRAGSSRAPAYDASREETNKATSPSP